MCRNTVTILLSRHTDGLQHTLVRTQQTERCSGYTTTSSIVGLQFVIHSVFIRILGLAQPYLVLGEIVVVILTIGSFSGKTSGTEYRILSLTPVFWSIIRMVGRFMRTISYVRVSELLFEMVMLVFMIMFFMAFAQCNSKVNEKDCIWKVAAYGLPAALLALVCSVPRIILSLIGSADLIYSQSSVEFADLGIALFIIAVVLTKVISKTESDETEEEEASEESEEAEEKAETEESTVITEE